MMERRRPKRCRCALLRIFKLSSGLHDALRPELGHSASNDEATARMSSQVALKLTSRGRLQTVCLNGPASDNRRFLHRGRPLHSDPLFRIAVRVVAGPPWGKQAPFPCPSAFRAAGHACEKIIKKASVQSGQGVRFVRLEAQSLRR